MVKLMRFFGLQWYKYLQVFRAIRTWLAKWCSNISNSLFCS